MRISHELANQISIALTQKSKAANDKLRAEIDLLVLMEYTKTIPKELVKLEKAFPDWVQKSGSIHIRYQIGERHRHYFTAVKAKVITKAGSTEFKPSASTKKKIIQFDKQEEALKELKKETSRAVLALGTAKRVLQQFPDSASVLKSKDSLPVVPVSVNVHDLKAKLQKQ